MAIRSVGKKFVVDVGRGAKRVRLSVDTYDEAKTKELEFQMALHKGETIVIDKKSSKGLTLQNALDLTYKKFWANQTSGLKALKNAELCLGFLGQDTLVKNVSTSMIDAMQDHFRKGGNADSTINRKLSALSCVLSYMVTLDELPAKPKIHFNRERNNRIRFLSLSEEKDLLDYFRMVGWHDIADYFIVCIDTGIRFEELTHVNTDRDIHDGHITLWKTKNDNPRTIPLTERAAKIIKDKPYILKLPKRQRRRVWDAAKDAMGLADDPHFVPYVCRHTCASRLIQRGASLLVVKDWMGHKSIQTTLRYAHLAPENLTKARELLEPPVVVTQVTRMTHPLTQTGFQPQNYSINYI